MKNPVLDLVRETDDGDHFGNAMMWFFRIADKLTFDHDGVPYEWQFRPSPLGAEEDELYHQLEQFNAQQLLHAGNVLNRYVAQLTLAGKDY